MAIRQFDLMHGAVLHKILRNGRPLSPTLIESDGSRSKYRLNDEVILYVKYRIIRVGEAVWQFAFSPKHLQDIAKLAKNSRVFLALVCAHRNLKGDTEVAFSDDDQKILQCLNLECLTKQQTIRVELVPNIERQTLYVSGKNVKPFPVPRNGLHNWNVPGR